MKTTAFSLLLLCLTLLPVSVQGADENTLKNHPSPYLAMHGNDPVHWQGWDKNIFERARRENKLVFVSIGYFACHWCHVMQRESYQDAKIADIINKHFIPVKVDRELQPALDARLIDFVERTRGYAGWPLNVFITPEGYPLLGLVYLPPKEFSELLVNMNQAWEEDIPGMKAMAESAAAALQKSDRSAGPDLDQAQIKSYQLSYLTQALQHADHLQGGFGEQSKFPLVPQLTLLLELYQRDKDKALGDFLRLTLDKMSALGMYDHLRGGFYRYVVGPDWLIPHFEKMLYDNAQLAVLYLDAAATFNNSEYKRIAYETLDFMLRELKGADAGMISSLSAIDNNNVEGGYYLWSDDELKKILTPDEHRIMKMHWGMEHAPALDAGHHAYIALTVAQLAAKLKMSVAQVDRVIRVAKDKLLERQRSRTLPRDNKLLASWNGLALTTLLRAGSDKKEYLQEARNIRDFIVNKLWDGHSLKRALVAGSYLGDATLEDYAYVSAGLLAWAKYTGKQADLSLVRNIVQQAWKRFYDEQGWLLSEDLIAGISSREAIIADGPMPSASASLIGVSIELAQMTNDKQMLLQARSALNRGQGILKTDNFWYATHLRAMQEAITYSSGRN